MQKLITISLSAVIFFFSISECLASTLIFKTQKEVKENSGVTELAVVDVSKYKQIRIGVVVVSPEKFEVPKFISFDAVEEKDLIFLSNITINSYYKSGSINIESPPSKLRVSTNDIGNYKIFIWAS